MNEDYLKETKTKKSKKPIIVTVILVLCALGLGGYLVYDKVIKKETVKTEAKKKPTETKRGVKQEISDIKIIGYEEGKSYLIGMKDNNWIELASNDNDIFYYGIANNKIYYYVHDEGFKYIDLYDESLESKLWLKDKVEYTPNSSMTGKYEGTGGIVDDNIYMIVHGDTLYSIPLKAESLKEAKKLVTSTDDIIIENGICLIKNYMFYEEYNNEKDKTSVVKYDVKSNKKEQIANNNVEDYSLTDQYLLINTTNNKAIRINKNNMQQEDITNLIKDAKYSNSYELIGDVLYFSDGHSLIKVVNGKKETIYKEKADYGIGNIKVLDENTIIIESDPASGGMGESSVIQNGKKLSKAEVKELKKKYTIEVILKNGTKKALYDGLEELWDVDSD